MSFIKVSVAKKGSVTQSPNLIRAITERQIVGFPTSATAGNSATACVLRVREFEGGTEESWTLAESLDTFITRFNLATSGASGTALGDLLGALNGLAVSDDTFGYVDSSGEGQLAPLSAKGRALAAAATNTAALNAAGIYIVTGTFSSGLCTVNTAHAVTNARIIPIFIDEDEGSAVGVQYQLTAIVDGVSFSFKSIRANLATETGDGSAFAFVIIKP